MFKKNTQKNTYENNSNKLLKYANMEDNQLLSALETERTGLLTEEAENRLEVYGKNEVFNEKPAPIYVQLYQAFMTPFSIVLFCLATISFFLDYAFAKAEDKKLSTVIVIVVMVMISGLLRFVQEYRSGLSTEKLKTMVKTTASVKRNGLKAKEIPIEEIVPGDIIYLSAGDMIPADIRLLTSKDLFVSQSSLTGESEPVEKFAINENIVNKSALELSNLCFMGTTVISGSAMAVVIFTGKETIFGSIAKSLTGKRQQTNFDKGVNSVSFLLIRFMLTMVPIVLLVNGFTKGDWLEAVMFALSIAVGMTPEMLPMIVTTNLAKGALNMAKKKTIVKKLNSIQNFGSMDILCTDKTGTLTEDKIVLEKHLNIHGVEDNRVLRHAYLNAYFQTGLKNLMDVAIIEHGDETGLNELNKQYTKVDEIPFDFQRRRMSVVIKDKSDKTQMVTKGAIEEMLLVSGHAEYQGEIVELTDEIKDKIRETTQGLNEQGMRVIAVAQKTSPSAAGIFSVKDEADMVLIGYIGFLDPPKKAAKSAIKALNDYGVSVKILTGDNDAVAKCICSQVGLDTREILLGSDISKLTDKELANVAENTTVFAKLSPMQKARVVSVLQSKGHTVGFMGDGINDAAAMRQSDVGISVDTAVDIAKESADIILLEKDLMVLEQGVIEGRRTFGNIIKYIKMTTSSNFGNMLSVLVASAFLPFLPMLPIHILVLNLIYDFSQISIPWDNMDNEYLRIPRKWNASSIGRFMLWIGPCSSIFDITTYIILFNLFGGNLLTSYTTALFQTGWFIESLFTQTLIVHMIRTEKIPFIKSRASRIVCIMTLCSVTTGLLIPYTLFGASIGMVALPLNYFPWLVGIVLMYALLTQLVKTLYIKRFGEFL